MKVKKKEEKLFLVQVVHVVQLPKMTMEAATVDAGSENVISQTVKKISGITRAPITPAP